LDTALAMIQEARGLPPVFMANTQWFRWTVLECPDFTSSNLAQQTHAQCREQATALVTTINTERLFGEKQR